MRDCYDDFDTFFFFRLRLYEFSTERDGGLTFWGKALE